MYKDVYIYIFFFFSLLLRCISLDLTLPIRPIILSRRNKQLSLENFPDYETI